MSGASGVDNLVVVAHPDDEALWLMSALPTADVVVAALPKASKTLTDRRRAVKDQYPLRHFDFLDLQSAEVFRQMDGRRGRPLEHGVTLRGSCPSVKAQRYRSNYPALLDALDPYLHTGSIVYTHNPWGEYGHPEHVQVSNAVVHLARKHRCSVWAWEGFSARWQLRRGVRLRADYFRDRVIARAPAEEMAVDLGLYREIRALYQRHEAWTWDDAYDPPVTSRLVQLVRDGVVLVGPDRRRMSAPVRMVARAAAGRARRVLSGWVSSGKGKAREALR